MYSIPSISLSDEGLIERAHKLLKKGEVIALAVIISKVGSGPRKVGAKIIVSSNGSVYGSLGGGPFERHVINEALKAIRDGKPRKMRYSFTGKSVEGAINTGLICGGIVEVFIDVMKPDPRALIFGVGRVGKPLAYVLKFLGFKLIIADTDENVITDELKGIAENVVIGSPAEIGLRLHSLLRDGDIVIITHGDPESDYTVLREALKSKASYVGLLGSKRKVAEFIKRLRNEGISDEVIVTKLRAPVGLGIGAETPEEISISIASEILAFLRGISNVSFRSMVKEILSKSKAKKHS